MAVPHRFRSKGIQHLDHRYVGRDPQKIAEFPKAGAEADVAQALYAIRTRVGLTQRQLATMVGTSASVICKLEDADYDGHSLSMLRRIGAAMGQRVEIRFRPISTRQRRPKPANKPSAVRRPADGSSTCGYRASSA
jgi:hypothetical protein